MRTISRILRNCLSLAALVLIFGLVPAHSQDAPDISQGLTPDATYFGGDFEFIDTATGRLNIHIPLLSDKSQRGNLNFDYVVSTSGPGLFWPSCSEYIDWVDDPVTGEPDPIYEGWTCYWQETLPSSNLPDGPIPAMGGTLIADANGLSIDDGLGGVHPMFCCLANDSYNVSIDGSGIEDIPVDLDGYQVGTKIFSKNGVQWVVNVSTNPYTAYVQDSNGNRMTAASNVSGYPTWPPPWGGGIQFSPGGGLGLSGGTPQNAWTMTDTLGRAWSFGPAANTDNCPATTCSAPL